MEKQLIKEFHQRGEKISKYESIAIGYLNSSLEFSEKAEQHEKNIRQIQVLVGTSQQIQIQLKQIQESERFSKKQISFMLKKASLDQEKLSKQNKIIQQLNYINMLNYLTCSFIEREKNELIQDKIRTASIDTLKIANLPEDILFHIQSYFTYETRISLIEAKYKPISLLLKGNIRTIHKYNYYVRQLDTNERVKFEIQCTSNDFWGCYLPTLCDRKTLLCYLIYYIKKNDPKAALGLFREVILTKHKQFVRNKK